jgi:hypothetical protein|tara:strand:- start:404 stop:679 length:276 start_codon:yes stop_codon:yes gene_type:complete
MAFKMKGFPMQQTSALKSSHHGEPGDDDPKEIKMQAAQVEARDLEKSMDKKPGSYSSDSEFKKEDPDNYNKLKYLYSIGYPDDPYSPTGTP